LFGVFVCDLPRLNLWLTASVCSDDSLGIDKGRIDTSNTISAFGSPYATFAGAAGLYFLRLGTHNEHLAETGRLGAEAVADASLVVEGFKLATNRERPNEGIGQTGAPDRDKRMGSFDHPTDVQFVHRTTLRVFVTATLYGIAIALVYFAYPALIAIIFSFFLAYLLEPIMKFSDRRLWHSRLGSIALSYLVLVVVITGFVFLLGGTIGRELSTATQMVPAYWNEIKSGAVPPALAKQTGLKRNLQGKATQDHNRYEVGFDTAAEGRSRFWCRNGVRVWRSESRFHRSRSAS